MTRHHLSASAIRSSGRAVYAAVSLGLISTTFLSLSFFAAFARLSWMRRVSSSWRFNWTNVYSSVMAVLACPAILSVVSAGRRVVAGAFRRPQTDPRHPLDTGCLCLVEPAD
jgi:hypothetical protein